MRFEFATAHRIIFGPGAVRELPAIAAAFSRRAFVVTGKDKIRHAGIVADLEAAGFHCTLFGVPSEPDEQLVRTGVAALSNAGVVIAIGGGSALDAAKAIAATAEPRLPFIAVPTTAGTGAEVTPNAVLRSPENQAKISLRGPHLLPAVALVDPNLTLSSPRHVTAASGLDALTQLIEPFTSNKANPFTDSLCREGLPIAARSLPRLWSHPKDPEARAGMSYAALLSGMALANAGLGVVHGFASPIGGKFDAPHGAVCAALLPNAMSANIAALTARAPESAALERYAEIARIFTGDPNATASHAVEWVRNLVRQLEIPGLGKYGISVPDLATLAEKAEQAGSMKFNPIPLTRAELVSVLTTSL